MKNPILDVMSMFYHILSSSTDYRKRFFERYRPAFGDYYFCSYCGRPVKKDRVTVDHLYPVDRVKTSRSLRRRLEKCGYDSVNDPKNLVPACRSCNSRKGTKTGLWIIAGSLGRIQPLWFVRWPARIAVIKRA